MTNAQKNPSSELKAFWAKYLKFKSFDLSDSGECYEKFFDKKILGSDRSDFQPVSYQEFLEFVAEAWKVYSQKRLSAERLFTRKNDRLARDIYDPRWLAFHPDDLAGWDQMLATLPATKTFEKTFRNFVMWVNAQFEIDTKTQKRTLSEEVIPQPTVPQAFQGDILKTRIWLMGTNPGEDARIQDAETAVYDQSLREAVLAGLREESEEGLFPSLAIEEKFEYQGWYTKRIYGKTSLLRQLGFETPASAVAQLERFAYQTPSAAQIPKDLIAHTKSSQLMGDFVTRRLTNSGGAPDILVVRNRPGWEELVHDEATDRLEKNSYASRNGQMYLSVQNLVTQEESEQLSALATKYKHEEMKTTHKKVTNIKDLSPKLAKAYRDERAQFLAKTQLQGVLQNWH